MQTTNFVNIERSYCVNLLLSGKITWLLDGNHYRYTNTPPIQSMARLLLHNNKWISKRRICKASNFSLIVPKRWTKFICRMRMDCIECQMKTKYYRRRNRLRNALICKQEISTVEFHFNYCFSLTRATIFAASRKRFRSVLLENSLCEPIFMLFKL